MTRRSNASSPPPCDISDDPLFPTPTHHPFSVTSSLLDLCRTAYTAVSVEPFRLHYCSRQRPIQTERPANLPFRTLGPLAWQPQLRLKNILSSYGPVIFGTLASGHRPTSKSLRSTAIHLSSSRRTVLVAIGVHSTDGFTAHSHPTRIAGAGSSFLATDTTSISSQNHCRPRDR